MLTGAPQRFVSTITGVPLQFLVIVSSAFIIFYALNRYLGPAYRKQLPLPPGPPPLPVIGNLLNIPKKISAREYRRLSDKYGMCYDSQSFVATKSLDGPQAMLCI